MYSLSRLFTYSASQWLTCVVLLLLLLLLLYTHHNRIPTGQLNHCLTILNHFHLQFSCTIGVVSVDTQHYYHCQPAQFECVSSLLLTPYLLLSCPVIPHTKSCPDTNYSMTELHSTSTTAQFSAVQHTTKQLGANSVTSLKFGCLFIWLLVSQPASQSVYLSDCLPVWLFVIQFDWLVSHRPFPLSLPVLMLLLSSLIALPGLQISQEMISIEFCCSTLLCFTRVPSSPAHTGCYS